MHDSTFPLKVAASWLATSLVVALHLQAQQRNPSAGVEPQGSPALHPIAEIPFEIRDDLMILKAKVGAHEAAANFMFDTGCHVNSDAGCILVTHKRFADGLSLMPRRNVSPQGGGAHHEFVLDQTISLADGISSPADLMLVDLQGLEERMGKDLAGLMGYALFRKYLTCLDYARQRIALYSYEDRDRLVESGYTAIPFAVENGRMEIDVSMELADGENIKGVAILDTGSDMAILVEPTFNRVHQLHKRFRKTLVTGGIGVLGEFQVQVACIQSLTLGGSLKLAGAMAIGMIDPAAEGKQVPPSRRDFDIGVLGMEVIRRFHVVIDYRGNTIYLKPNQFHGDPYNIPMSGLDLVQRAGNIIINRVLEGSPAQNHGLRVGDRVLSINGDPGGDIERYRRMLKQEGTTAEIVVLRKGGGSAKVKLELHRLL